MTMKTQAPARQVEFELITFRGNTFRVRIEAGDPHWRAKALKSLPDPLSPEAHAIANAPKTWAEVAAWDEQCRREEETLEIAALLCLRRELEVVP
jgi:hypothetical protein